MNKKSLELLKQHEGFRAQPYHCTAGKLTIGYGYNLEANPLRLQISVIENYKHYGMSEEVAETLLILMVSYIEKSLSEQISNWASLNDNRKGVLVNMAYNLGIPGLLNFKNTLTLIYSGNFIKAASCMLDSKWASQVGQRAKTLAKIMQTGEIK